jgi:hypothetical protein
MFGVLVVALCPDRVAELGFGTGERQIPLIASFRCAFDPMSISLRSVVGPLLAL